MMLALAVFCIFFCGNLFLKQDCKNNIFTPFAVGLIVVMGIFEIVSVPVIIFDGSFKTIYRATVSLIAIGTVFGIIVFIIDLCTKNIRFSHSKLTGEEIFFFICFATLAFYQIYRALTLKVADGDDSYYLAQALYASKVDINLYRSDPYTGLVTDIQYRYALAPFPYLIALLSRLSGLHSSTVAHCLMPVLMIIATYIVWDLYARRLFKESRANRYMFLSFVALFAMFGNYSINTAETFMLSRARQGKEALCALIIPFLIYLLWSECENAKITAEKYILIIFTELAASFTSLFGNILVLILIFGMFIYYCISRRKLFEIIKLCSLAAAPMLVVGLYFVL